MATPRRLRLIRLALVICFALLSGYQCWTLLEMFSGEPVSASVSYTPWEDVDVPAVTVCGKPFAWQEYRFIFGMNGSSVSRQLWMTGDSLKRLFLKCKPLCLPRHNSRYPDGEVRVGIGSWTSWVSLTESALCHTLTPNVTWGQLAQAACHRSFELELTFGGKRSLCDYRLFVHPRRRPVVSGLGVRRMQQDLRQRVLCRSGDSAEQIRVKLISRVVDRESLQRAPCDPAEGYFYETCLTTCAHRQWAERSNCSTPEMITDYPQLAQCSRRTLKRMVGAGGLNTNVSECDCLPACRSRSFVADTGVEPLPLPPDAVQKLLVVQVSAASIAEEVTTERRSYRLPSLLSEMGGFISLVLGVSVLSLADMLTEALTKTGRRAAPAPAAEEKLQDDSGRLHSPNKTKIQGKAWDLTGSGSHGDSRGSATAGTAGRSKSSSRLVDSLVDAELRSEQGNVFTVQG